MRAVLFGTLLLVSSFCFGQNGKAATSVPGSLAPGTTLPIHLTHSVVAGRTGPGTILRGKLTQRVPLSDSQFLNAGTVVLGTVVESSAASGMLPARLTLRFDTLVVSRERAKFSAGAVALANFVAVSDTGIPCSGAVDRANPDAANWTTCQVGGEQVVRSGWSGPLINETTHSVGFADFNGVYANPSSPGALPHALGVFSSQAHGLYGYGPAATLTSTPASFTIRSPGHLTLHGEDNLLLQIDPSAAPPTAISTLR